MKNTKVSYLYRDASNYKVHTEVVLAGSLSSEQKKAIIDSLDEGLYFIPSKVGLPEKRFEPFDPQEDHPWFELADAIMETDEVPTEANVTAQELYEKFISIAGKWDDD